MYYSFTTHKFYQVKKHITKDKNKILDIGCGNHSPSNTKKIFPYAEYHGIDIIKNPDYTKKDEEALDKFYLLNLDLLQFDEIPDNYFDVMIMNHVLEHLHNGEEVLKAIIKKLKPGGVFYIEFPSEKSVNFPSLKGTLNFYDDPTHVKIYTTDQVKNWLGKETEVLSTGIVRSLPMTILTPYKMLRSLVTRGYVRGYTVWDLYGFGKYIFLQKK